MARGGFEYKPAVAGPGGLGRTAAVLLIAVVLAGGGFFAGTTWQGRQPSPPPDSSSSGAPSASASPSVEPAGPVDGVPVGFARTPRGAGEAASAYVTAIGSWKGASRDVVRRRLNKVVAGSAAGLVDKLMPAPAYEGNGNVTADIALRVATNRGASTDPLPAEAKVKANVFVLGVFGAGGDGKVLPAAGLSAGYGQVSMELAWDAGTWKITSWTVAPVTAPSFDSTSRPGGLTPDLLGPGSWTPHTS